MQLISPDAEYRWSVAEVRGYKTHADKSIRVAVVLDGPGPWYKGQVVTVPADKLRPVQAA
ncbi:hypothetical protein GS966_27665 [Rhodococcus hoagii]|nr:hypothetical protein [Prescottella equi]NKS10235.1 hypothetical protein [Prescottella equi]NKS35226.1 hypothetical protein [Prescottella equi]NKS62073.1 hypothetical protein [Prescottella equi]NKS74817.1 hypothetical protein [Prescottella equi]